MRVTKVFTVLTVLFALVTTNFAAEFPGKLSDWHGFQKYDFVVGAQPVLVVCPAKSATGKPWV